MLALFSEVSYNAQNYASIIYKSLTSNDQVLAWYYE